MAKKPLTEKTIATINIETGGRTNASENLVRNIVSAIMHGRSAYDVALGDRIIELDRTDTAAAITIEHVDIVYDDNGNIVFEEEAQGDAAPVGSINQEPNENWRTKAAAEISAAEQVLQAMRPDESKSEPEPEKADDCDCPACQIRRAIMANVDKAKAGSDRTEIGLYAVTSRGLIRVA